MLLLLPPSETKRRGGEGPPLDLTALSFPSLTRARRATIAALRELSTDLDAAARALKLGPKSAVDAALNRDVRRSATMPAIDRFDGVLYESLDAPGLDAAARAWLGRNVVVSSALFGLLGALDAVPAYRLSADSRLPGLSLGRHWRDAQAAVLADRDGLVLDLRSEAYAALGPAPARHDSVYLRVVTESGDGRRRALNHFNKAAKGRLTRALAESDADPTTVGELLDWAASAGLDLRPGASGEIDLVVEAA
ncbi:YaaA family protein [Schumannella sp. 10F1B-5-1]|uniref:YaaA family protein n=1 Tax=Schumannella sp. 10F1B-5-1 TaxID=2590780 RepID=UPI001131A79A|nr:peroxide stress protein YaaA [Schumannella sp. 10F1B-5-1]TPW70686.1 peroxide stress protein YaaA [Schumannella sp. 10F1B-5-1]